MAINYELLRTFVAAGAAPTFAAAAARRHVTPSAVSQQIGALEAQLGVPLFQRLGRRARLTEGGRALLASVSEHLDAIDQALEEVSAEPGLVRGSVRIGAPGPFARVWLRPRLLTLMRAHPALRIEARFDVPSVLARELAAGAHDLCILVSDPGHSAIELQPIFVEEFVAVASKAYLAAVGHPRTATDLRRHRFLVFDRDQAMHRPWWQTRFGRREPLPTDIAAEVASLDELLALCEGGLGIAVLPNYFVAASLNAGSLAPVLPPAPGERTPRNQIYLAWRRGAPLTGRFTAVKKALAARAFSAPNQT